MAEKQEKQWPCEHCGQDFENEAALKSHIHYKHKEEPGRALVKASPLDMVIEKLQVPMVPKEFNGDSNIYWSGFNEGVRYGANTVLAGIRSAQELSSLGIAQATPIIKMAQEMRQAEGQAAQALASEFAQAALESNKEIIGAIKAQAIAQSPDPWQAMMVQAMSPIFSQVMGNLTAAFQPKPGQPGGKLPGSPPQQPGQPGGQQLPAGVQQATEEEVEEAFQ